MKKRVMERAKRRAKDGLMNHPSLLAWSLDSSCPRTKVAIGRNWTCEEAMFTYGVTHGCSLSVGEHTWNKKKHYSPITLFRGDRHVSLPIHERMVLCEHKPPFAIPLVPPVSALVFASLCRQLSSAGISESLRAIEFVRGNSAKPKYFKCEVQ